jgi:hypothetical protein
LKPEHAGRRKLTAAQLCASSFTTQSIRDVVRLFVVSNHGRFSLNHKSGVFRGIVGVYQRHDFIDEMRAGVSAWEARLVSLLKP